MASERSSAIMAIDLSAAQKERARALIAKGIPEDYKGMTDEDAILVIRYQTGYTQEEAEMWLTLVQNVDVVAIDDDGQEIRGEFL